MGGYAWVTLATNDAYALGALVLGHSLKHRGTKNELVVLITPGVTPYMREQLSTVFTVVQEVNVLDSKDETNLQLLKRPELGITFTKLNCWRLTQYEKCVFLDADTLVLQNCDELFEREELSAAPDVGWPDCFNSGVFVYSPSNETYQKLIDFAVEQGSFDGGDQGLLNLYFSDWATKDINKHLPFIYNLCSLSCYSYLPAFKQFGQNTKIIHFIGTSKPWLQYFNFETRKVQPSPDLKHLEAILQHWWDILCTFINPEARNRTEAPHTSFFFSTNDEANSTKKVCSDSCEEHEQNVNPVSVVDHTKICLDSWDEYELKHANVDAEQKDTNVDVAERIDADTVFVVEQPNPELVLEQPNPEPVFEQPNPEPVLQQPDPEPVVEEEQPPDISNRESQGLPNFESGNDACDDNENSAHSSQEFEQPELWKCAHSSLASAPFASVCQKDTSEETLSGGITSGIAQLTLGLSQETEIQHFLRRQHWEAGNIDYMGQDSFDNIWNKISQTLSSQSGQTSKEK